MDWDQLRRRIILSLGLGLLVLLGLALYGDLRALGASAARFPWRLLPLVLGLTLVNYALRFAKWEVYLRQLGIVLPSRAESLRLFLAGMTMAITPAKAGEVLKAYLLKGMNGTPVARSAPVVLAERLTDGLGMLVWAFLGLVLFDYGRPILLGLGGATALGLWLLHRRSWVHALLDGMAGRPLLGRVVPPLRRFYEATVELLGLRPLLIGWGLSVLSWGAECLALGVILTGLGLPLTPHTLLLGAFAFAAATLFGLLSGLPGGLGTAEASMTGMLQLLGGLGAAPAAFAALLIRLSTLWLGVGLGGIALMGLLRRHPGLLGGSGAALGAS